MSFHTFSFCMFSLKDCSLKSVGLGLCLINTPPLILKPKTLQLKRVAKYHKSALHVVTCKLTGINPKY